jgi:hypothetical protein
LVLEVAGALEELIIAGGLWISRELTTFVLKIIIDPTRFDDFQGLRPGGDVMIDYLSWYSERNFILLKVRSEWDNLGSLVN